MAEELFIVANAEQDNDGRWMVKLTGFTNLVASGFRFPASDARLVAKNIHDQIIKAAQEAEKNGALQNSEGGSRLQIAKSVDGKNLAGLVKQSLQGPRQN